MGLGVVVLVAIAFYLLSTTSRVTLTTSSGSFSVQSLLYLSISNGILDRMSESTLPRLVKTQKQIKCKKKKTLVLPSQHLIVKL